MKKAGGYPMNRTKKWLVVFAAVTVAAMFALSACGNKTEQGGGGQPQPQPQSEAAQVETQTPAAPQESGATEYKLYAVGQGDTFYSAEEYGEFMKQLMTGLADSFGADENTQSEITDVIDFSDGKLTLNDDGTAEISLFGSTAECSWSEDGGTITFSVTAASAAEGSTMTNGSEMKATLENGLIKLTDASSSSVMVFAADGADTSGIKISSMKDALSGLGD